MAAHTNGVRNAASASAQAEFFPPYPLQRLRRPRLESDMELSPATRSRTSGRRTSLLGRPD